jgi:hypothetical protein
MFIDTSLQQQEKGTDPISGSVPFFFYIVWRLSRFICVRAILLNVCMFLIINRGELKMVKILNIFKKRKRQYPAYLPDTVLSDDLEKKVFQKYYF